MAKAGVVTLCFVAATALFIAPTALTFGPAWNPSTACDEDLIKTTQAFVIVSCVLAGVGMIMAAMGFAGKGIKAANLGLAAGAAVCSVIPWAIAASLWGDDKCTHSAAPGKTFKPPEYPMPFLPLFFSGTACCIFALIAEAAMADPEEAPAAAPAADAAAPRAVDAGNAAENNDGGATPKPADAGEGAAANPLGAGAAAEAAEREERERREREEREQRERDAEAQRQRDAEAQRQREAAEAEAARQREEARRREEEIAEQQRREEAAAAAARSETDAGGAAAATAGHEGAEIRREQINWQEVNAKLPHEKGNNEQKRRRFEWFAQIDKDGSGRVTYEELLASVETVLQLPSYIDMPIVVKCAFDTAKSAGQAAGVNEGPDLFLEKNEFRLYLLHMRNYFELYVLFSELDTSNDMLISLEEFQKALPTLREWGADIPDAAAAFRELDKSGGGQITFAEFIPWALKMNVDTPDDDE